MSISKVLLDADRLASFFEFEKFPNSTILQEMGQGYDYDTDQLYKIKNQSSKFFEFEKFLNSTTLRRKKNMG